MLPEQKKTVFADPRGIRRRLLQTGAVLGVSAFLAAAGYFFWSLTIEPQLRLPAIVRNYQARLRALPPAKMPKRDPKDDWRRILRAGSKGPGGASRTAKENNKVVLGYVAPWDPASLLSLERHADQLTHVAADWFSLTGVEAKLEEDRSDKVRLLCVGKGIGFLPILRNLDGDEWQPEAVETLATMPSAERGRFLDHLVGQLPPGSKGLLVEWSQLDPSIKQDVGQLVQELADRLHARAKELWFSIPSGSDFDALDLPAIAAAADRLVASLYDENSKPSDPGPLASTDWFEGWLKTMMVYGDPGQWVIGIGNYGYDWRRDNSTVRQVGFADAMARASQAGVDPYNGIDPADDSPEFNYVAGADQKENHEVWFLDGVNFWNQRRVTVPYQTGGVGLYRLGLEDPGVWDVLRMDPAKPPGSGDLATLSRIIPDEQVASTGSGDFLALGEDSRPGERKIDVSPQGILTEHYITLPLPENIVRQGEGSPGQVALTFDDGPDPKWTPRILQILKEKNAPAAFFILGSQAQRYPDLLDRIVRGGHEIGNHSYTHRNLAQSGDEQIELELNATTRLIEALTGRSTAYFRPPYNADGTPVEPGELRALRVARDLGYLTVGQSIDPDDWERPGAETLLRRVKKQRAEGGNIILLHDAGGDRSQTVAALPGIIDYLRARGDTIVPLSEMIGLPKETVMPLLREQGEPLAARYVYGSFAVMRFLENTAWTLLAVVTLLALVRVMFFVGCAVRHRKHELTVPVAEPVTYPAVSVLLAAYNEERVIASTIRHLLESDYPAPLQIVVVDDGSKDETATVVTALAACEPRVTLILQPNGGKSTALNRGMAEAVHPVIVMIDADTMVAPDAIRKLVAPLSDPKVGAVSGYVRVGNHRHWLGKCQDVEYAAAFQIDRRAQDLLGCITVAPGALSAFRRAALEQAGPISHDTLAEDTDLTLQLHRLGWKVAFSPQAIADTEAPEHVRALVSQRFRWSFGTLQCLWKHGEILFAPGSRWLGWFALPSIWIFQIAVVAVTPILDLMVLWSLWWGRGTAIWPYFLASLLLDVGLTVAALAIAGRKLREGWVALPMRLLYRPLLGYVVWKCILKALAGSWVRWSKLDRTASAIRQKEAAAYTHTAPRA